MPELKQYTIKAATAAGIVAEIEAGVAGGSLVPGQPLPSVRHLALAGKVSPATVATALAELRRRGVVVTEPRRGTRIGERPPLSSQAPPMPVPAGARDLSRGNPDPALLPDLAAALSRCEQPVRLYGEAPELPALLDRARSALAADGVPCEHLCVVSGALDGIERVLQSWLRPGDRVAVESPGYASLYDLLRAQSLGLEPIAVDRRGMLPASLSSALRRGASAVVVTPRGQNPTGAAHDASRAAELREVIAAHPRAILVEDDHLGPVAGAPLHSLAGAGERWAATRSVAKALGPDLRLAILSGDQATLARVRGRQLCGPGWVSHVLQRLVAELWGRPETTALIEQAAARYAERRERLIASLLAAGVPAQAESGLNVWVEVAEEAATMSALLARGWVVAPGARYKLDGGPAAIRITTAALEPDESDRFAADLADVLSPAPVSRTG
jgi:DNA-binding transcriptional MocR family regulator